MKKEIAIENALKELNIERALEGLKGKYLTHTDDISEGINFCFNSQDKQNANLDNHKTQFTLSVKCGWKIKVVGNTIVTNNEITKPVVKGESIDELFRESKADVILKILIDCQKCAFQVTDFELKRLGNIKIILGSYITLEIFSNQNKDESDYGWSLTRYKDHIGLIKII